PGSKYGHWQNLKTPKTPEKWLETATQVNDSWWPGWEKWIAKYAGGDVKARTPGDGKREVIGDAPGSYVPVRAEGEDGRRATVAGPPLVLQSEDRGCRADHDRG